MPKCPVPVYLVLLHHPIQNRNGEEVTTAVTNLDLHDIARSARTYGILKYFLVTPIQEQHQLLGRILSHWNQESQRKYHPDRFEALSRVQLVYSFEEIQKEIIEKHGESAEVVLTDAREILNERASQVSYTQYRSELFGSNRKRPAIIVLGTGWGVAPSFFPAVDRILAPIYGPERPEEGGYNHLSVRAAAAVILDRLLGS